MAEVPPENPTNYPRQQLSLDPSLSADKLQLLIEGYFGLNYIFLLNLVLAVGASVLRISGPAVWLAALAVTTIIVGIASYPYNLKIARGSNQPDGTAIAYSFLVFAVGWVCCGIIGYAIIQTMAGTQMKKYGLKTSLLMTKKKAMQVVEQWRAMQAAPAQPGNYPRPPA